MSEWCQNKKCAEKKTKGQIRGNKGSKYYQSNKSSGYYEYWCRMGGRDVWWNEHKDTCIQAVGFIDKQIIHLEDAWYVDNRNDYTQRAENRYHLRNLLKGVDQPITREQAQTPEQIAESSWWYTISDAQAKELAVTLGLAS